MIQARFLVWGLSPVLRLLELIHDLVDHRKAHAASAESGSRVFRHGRIMCGCVPVHDVMHGGRLDPDVLEVLCWVLLFLRLLPRCMRWARETPFRPCSHGQIANPVKEGGSDPPQWLACDSMAWKWRRSMLLRGDFSKKMVHLLDRIDLCGSALRAGLLLRTGGCKVSHWTKLWCSILDASGGAKRSAHAILA
jgi:hypothetical protein